MLNIGCDLHARFQQIALLDTTTGEIVTRRWEDENGEARKFYSGLPESARVGIEATGCTQWFERLLAELGHELWVGDAAGIRARAVRRQKTDTRDPEPLLELLISNRFPRIWVPSPQERDARQLLQHRDKLVRMRTSVKNQLHYLAMSQGVCRKRKLWSARGEAELEALALGPWASRRRQELLELLDRIEPRIEELDAVVKAEAERRAPSRSGATDEAEGRGAPLTPPRLADVVVSLDKADDFIEGPRLSVSNPRVLIRRAKAHHGEESERRQAA